MPKTKMIYHLWQIIFVWIIFFVQLTIAQNFPDCKVIEPLPNGSYIITIGSDTMLALTSEMIDSSSLQKVELRSLRKKLALTEEFLEKYDNTIIWYDTVLSQKNEYIKEMDSILIGYKKLIRDYKNLSEPWISFEGGIGATGSKNKPAVMMGLGVRRFRVWGFLQESNSGAFVGTTFRLF